MAILTSATNVICGFSVVPFTDFPWALILNSAMSGIGIYALRVVLLTVCLKILLFPLDLYQRYKMRKNQLITVRIKPQLDKLEKAYGSDPNVLRQKQAELNRREGMSYLSSCLPMIVTLVVFIWLWQSLQMTANFKQFENYVAIYDVYASAYSEAIGDGYDESIGSLGDAFASDFRTAYDSAFALDVGGGKTVSEAKQTAYSTAYASGETSVEYYELYASTYSTTFASVYEREVAINPSTAIVLASEQGQNKAKSAVTAYCEVVAQNSVYDFFYGIGEFEGKGYQRDSFLWIKDIWAADTPWANSFAPTTADFKATIGRYATESALSGIDEADLVRIVDSYEKVMAKIIDEGDYGVNGFLILPLFAVGLNALMQIITRKQQKKSGQDLSATAGQSEGCMTAMLFVTPLLMGYFAIQYCAAFTLYMVTNSTVSLLINLATTGLSKAMVPIDEEPSTGKKKDIAQKYGRPDPNSRK